ncbi:MAG: hypothetical protein U5K70_07955 [Halodesulfurarchaeum sp.]|nr:hypothetical protein [Halodesulfurarchaeum sp.]
MIPERYNWENFRGALFEPRKFFDEFKRIVNRIRHTPRELIFRFKYTSEFDIMKEDWDNLIILDSCRFDVLDEMDLFENLSYKIMKSSTSEEFIEEYFENNGDFGDTIYITANPYGARVTDTFYKNVVTFDRKFTENGKKAKVDNLGKGWEPEIVFNTALRMYKENPDKRLIIHFMQPHSPYFGEKSRSLREELREQGYEFWAWSDKLDRKDKSENDNVLYSLQEAAKLNIITKGELYEIYKENILVVMEYVEKLSQEIKGKTIVTADHGEMLGDSRYFVPKNLSGLKNNMGHGDGIYVKELRKVPWAVIDNKERREIIDEGVNKSGDKDINVENQLKALGYK